jgi:hypothetical protein
MTCQRLFWRRCCRNPNPAEVGCVMSWEVKGGRLAYQVAVEREKTGRLRCHCTCADAVFRAEAEGRYCKHVKGFLAWGESLAEPPPGEENKLRKGA